MSPSESQGFTNTGRVGRSAARSAEGSRAARREPWPAWGSVCPASTSARILLARHRTPDDLTEDRDRLLQLVVGEVRRRSKPQEFTAAVAHHPVLAQRPLKLRRARRAKRQEAPVVRQRSRAVARDHRRGGIERIEALSEQADL